MQRQDRYQAFSLTSYVTFYDVDEKIILPLKSQVVDRMEWYKFSNWHCVGRR